MAADSKDMNDEIKNEETQEAASTEAATDSAVAVAEKPAAAKATVGKLSAHALMQAFEAEQIAKNPKELPDIYVGDTVRIGVRIKEGNKERIQPFEGVIIAKRHGGMHEKLHPTIAMADHPVKSTPEYASAIGNPETKKVKNVPAVKTMITMPSKSNVACCT